MQIVKTITLVLFATVAYGQQPLGTFAPVGSYRGIGALVATSVAPGKEAGSERLYASYPYGTSGLDAK